MKLVIFCLVAVLFLSGCAEPRFSPQSPESTEQDAEISKTFKPDKYILNDVQVTIPHAMIYEKARWNSSELTFYSRITENTSLQLIREGIEIWNKEATGLVKFTEVTELEKAHFIVRYATAGEYNERNTSAITVTLGEAKLDAIDTGLFSLVRSAEMLYTPTSSECENKITIVHEIGHVLGFAHTTDVKSVMFPSVDCSAKITDEMKQTLRNLYSIEALPDLYFGDVNAEQHDKYIIINFTVWNRGLITSENVSIEIKLDDETKMHTLPAMSSGAGWMIPDAIYTERNVDLITLTIDSSQAKSDFDRDNNAIILKPI
ncbi:MAG: matrixin family metalloprotease [Candidatus Aenigmarchaeota archaeon]|nr:matrixin family metalloprotease [Candidatus Aenigmarchaeota archaeon]